MMKRALRRLNGAIPTGEASTIADTGRSAAHVTASGAPNEWPTTAGRSTPIWSTASPISRTASVNENGSRTSESP